MSRSHVIQFSLALVLSLSAGILIFNWMNRQPEQVVSDAGPKKVMIAVAAADLQKGTKIQSTHIRLSPYLQETLPVGHFKEPQILTGRVVANNVRAGEPITTSRLIENGVQYGGVSTMVAPGKRAIAVKGNKVLGLSGYIRPGNSVDVLVTLDDARRSKNKSVTKLVLENIRVLATGTELEQEGETTSSVDVYTLQMTPEESERLALADSRGTLHFALRNPADAEKIKTPGTDIPDILEQLATRRPARSSSRKAVPKPRAYTKVEVITGNQKQTLRF